jgi:hypothetical protein
MWDGVSKILFLFFVTVLVFVSGCTVEPEINSLGDCEKMSRELTRGINMDTLVSPRDECIADFAAKTKNISICEYYDDYKNKNGFDGTSAVYLCASMIMLATKNASHCESASLYSDVCYLVYARMTKDYSVCEKMGGILITAPRKNCYKEGEELGLCKMENNEWKCEQ